MRSQSIPMLNLECNPQFAPIHVSMESFFEFSFWLAEELQELVETTQWQEHRKELVNSRMTESITFKPSGQ